MKYRPQIVTAFFRECGIPAPVYEHAFAAPMRKWRFDLAWPDHRVALEVDGGIWVRGGHNRGAQMKKDWEKRNTAAAMGWRLLYCEPKDLCTVTTCSAIGAALRCGHGAMDVAGCEMVAGMMGDNIGSVAHAPERTK